MGAFRWKHFATDDGPAVIEGHVGRWAASVFRRVAVVAAVAERGKERSADDHRVIGCSVCFLPLRGEPSGSDRHWRRTVLATTWDVHADAADVGVDVSPDVPLRESCPNPPDGMAPLVAHMAGQLGVQRPRETDLGHLRPPTIRAQQLHAVAGLLQHPINQLRVDHGQQNVWIGRGTTRWPRLGTCSIDHASKATAAVISNCGNAGPALERVYAAIFLPGIPLQVRDDGRLVNKAAYVAVGMDSRAPRT